MTCEMSLVGESFGLAMSRLVRPSSTRTWRQAIAEGSVRESLVDRGEPTNLSNFVHHSASFDSTIDSAFFPSQVLESPIGDCLFERFLPVRPSTGIQLNPAKAEPQP
jgi:hypothetical protein